MLSGHDHLEARMGTMKNLNNIKLNATYGQPDIIIKLTTHYDVECCDFKIISPNLPGFYIVGDDREYIAKRVEGYVRRYFNIHFKWDIETTYNIDEGIVNIRKIGECC